ncbi:MAG: ATP-binding cassette domain-containing protein [Candidatus Bipolaricaulota bacterium]|nr:ATP-binding cassette domain-containing protein [Candidatus Bipolaricaulota bacterium]
MREHSVTAHLQLVQISKGFTRDGAPLPVLDKIDLEVQHGELVALIGPSGCGKTTLLHIIAGLISPDSGTIYLNGAPVTDGGHVAYMQQKDLLLPWRSALSNALLGPEIAREDLKEAEARTRQLFEEFGLAGFESAYPAQLSAGMRQRVALIRTLLSRREILLLDEPFGALDALTRSELHEWLLQARERFPQTTLFVTHDRLEALRLGDRVAVMRRGEILQIGTPEEVFGQPVSEAVASFVGVETILRGVVESQDEGFATVQIHTGPQVAVASTLPPGTKVILCIRPEEVTLFAPPAKATHGLPLPASSARNAFPARVGKIVPWGVVFKVHLDCGFPLVAFVTRPSLEALSLREGSLVGATFKATAVHVIAE